MAAGFGAQVRNIPSNLDSSKDRLLGGKRVLRQETDMRLNIFPKEEQYLLFIKLSSVFLDIAEFGDRTPLDLAEAGSSRTCQPGTPCHQLSGCAPAGMERVDCSSWYNAVWIHTIAIVVFAYPPSPSALLRARLLCHRNSSALIPVMQRRCCCTE